MEREDIARIFQDVLSGEGLRASIVRIERTDTGWRLDARDRADRLVSVDLPDGPAATVRAALERWTARQE